MLESFQSKIQHIGCDKAYSVWGKYFLKDSEPPRDFSKQYPQLGSLLEGLKYKVNDKNNMKNQIKLMNDKADIQKILAPLFGLDKPIDEQTFILFSKATGISLSKSLKKHYKFVFMAGMREFIKIVYQFQNIIQKTMLGNGQENIIRYLCYIPSFFSQFEEKKYLEDFIVVLGSFYDIFSQFHTNIFAENVDISIRKLWVKFIASLAPLSNTELKLRQDHATITLTFIMKVLPFILTKTQPWDTEYCNNISFIFKSFSGAIKHHTLILSQSAYLVISGFQKNQQVPKIELLKFGCSCLDIFIQVAKCGAFDENSVSPAIIFFIKWAIMNFPLNLSNDSLQTLTDINDPPTLGPLGLSQYLSYMPIIDYKPIDLTHELVDVFDKVKAIIEQTKNQALCLIGLLKEIENKSFNEQLLRTYFLFVCQIIFSCKDEESAKAFKDVWYLIFQPRFFPTTAGAKYDKQATMGCLLLNLRCFMNSESLGTAILTTISDYIQKNGEICFSYFFCLLNSLLVTEESSRFGTIFSNSKLLELMIDISKRRLVFYDFLRNFIEKNLTQALMSKYIANFICESYLDEKRHDSSFKLIEMGLRLGENAGECVYNMIQGITHAISKLLQSKSSRVIELFTLILTSIQQLPDMVLSQMVDTFDICSQIALVFPDQLDVVIQLFVQVSKLSSAALDSLLSPDCKVYLNLSNAMQYSKDDNLVNLLLSLATAESQQIRNPKALDLVFQRAATSTKENVIIQKIYDMCNSSPENVLQLYLANGPENILKRLETAKDQNIIKALVSLYTKLCSSRFTASSFYTAIRIIKRATFEIPQTILKIYGEIIRTQKSESSPPIFFHFNGHGTGIFGPTTNLGENFSLVTSFKVHDIQSANNFPILSLHPARGTGVSIAFLDKKLRLVSHDSNKKINLQFNCLFQSERWYSIMVLFTQKTVNLYVDGINDSTVTTPVPLPVFDRTEINIATETKSARSSGLQADIGSIFILKSIDPKQLLLIKETVPASLSELLIVSYLPSNVHRSSIKNVAPSISSVPFRGIREKASKSIVNVLSMSTVAPNMIQLFSRLNGCDKCTNTKSLSYCKECGALDLKSGNEYLISLLDINAQLLKLTKKYNDVLLSMKAPILISQLISQIKIEYFDNNCINKLLEMFDAIQDSKLARLFVQAFWMNFDLMALLPLNQQVYFFTTAQKAFDSNKSAFLDPFLIKTVLYKYINESNNSGLRALLEQFVQKLISSANSKDLFSIFFSVTFSNVSPQSTLAILNMVHLLLTRNDQILLTALQDFSYYPPFVALMAIPDSNVQIHSLECIYRLSRSLNNKNISDTMIQCAVAYNKSENDERFLSNLTVKLNDDIDFLPLWTTVCSKLGNTSTNKALIASNTSKLNLEKFTKVPLWYYWVFTAAPLDANKIIPCINEGEDLSMLFDFFDAYSNETGMNLSNVKMNIVKSMISRPAISPQVLKVAFKYLFFTKIQTFPSKSNSLEHYLSLKLKLLTTSNFHSLFHINVQYDPQFESQPNYFGKWNEIDIARDLLKKISLETSFYIQFDDSFTVHSFVLFAYLAHTIAIFEGKDKHRASINSIFPPLLETVDIVTAYTAASILRVDWDLPSLYPFLDIYTDSEDSPQLQLFKFEEKLLKHGEILNSFSRTLMNSIQKALVCSSPSIEPNNDTSLNTFCTYSNSSVYAPILEIYDDFKNEQVKEIEIERIHRANILTNFRANLQIGCGPWAQDTDKIQFIMMNQASRKGVHNTMRININSSFTTGSNVSTNYKTTRRQNSNKIKDVKLISIGNVNEGEITCVDDALLFEGKQDKIGTRTRIAIKADNVSFVFTERRFSSYPEAIEIFTHDNRSFLFSLPSTHAKNSLMKQMENIFRGKDKLDKSKFNIFTSILSVNPGLVQKVSSVEIFRKTKITELWQAMKLSNFEYIYYLNLLSGRSFNNIEYYPIFPAITGNIPTPDLKDPKFYGDFPKYTPPTSTGEDIASMLIRVLPYSGLTKSNKVVSVADIHIGIPELYYFPVMFLNENKIQGIDDVKLPQWAPNPTYYCAVLRRSLESEFVSLNLNRWIDSAFSDSQLFASPHPPRGTSLMQSSLSVDLPLPSPLITMKKCFALCLNKIIDVRESRNANQQPASSKEYQISNDIQGAMLAASKHLGIIIFGTRKTNSVTVLFISPGTQPNSSASIKSQLLSLSNSQENITCASIVGNKYIITGTSDSAVIVWKIGSTFNSNGIPNITQLTQTRFHNESITSIAGNAEIGLVVSIDRHYNIVFATLLNEVFIKSVPLELSSLESKVTPMIEVFKSGYVVVITPELSTTSAFLFSPRGKRIFSIKIPGKVVDSGKFYVNYAFEYVVLGIENSGLLLLDLINFQVERSTFIKIENFKGKFTAVSKYRVIIAETNGGLKTFKL